jgi:hypothetical protein
LPLLGGLLAACCQADSQASIETFELFADTLDSCHAPIFAYYSITRVNYHAGSGMVGARCLGAFANMYIEIFR